MKRIFTAICFALLRLTGHAYVESPTGTFTTTGSQSDVQAAINAASAGAIIVIPAGTFNWTTTGNGVAINAIDQITIHGAGIGVTIINDACDGSTSQALFNFQNYHLAGKTFTIYGLTVDSDATLYSTNTILTSAPMGTGGVVSKIYNIKMTDIGQAGSTRGINISSAQGNYDEAIALIYNCELIGRPVNGSSQLITVVGNDYEFPPTVASTTKSSWYKPAGMGGSLATFVENCTLTNTNNQDSSIETYSGGRVVVRYCTLNTFIVGAHGNDSSTRAGHTIEVYNNTINQTLGSGMPNEIVVRGGTAYYYNNTITESGGGSTFPIQMQLYRAAGYTQANGNPFVISLLTAAGSFVTGRTYTISAVGTTNWVAIGAASNTAGVVFVATGAGSGTGTASNTAYVGRYTFNTGNSRYERDTDHSKYFAYVSGEWRLYGDGLHQLTHPAATTLKADQVVTYPDGTYAASGAGDIVVASGGSVRIYNNNLLNGSEGTDGNVAIANGSGTHTGSSGATTLTDGTKSWSTNELLGYGTAALDDGLFSYYIWNMTSGAGAFITANNATTVTAALTGGTRQTWTSGDSYVITFGYPGLDQPGTAGPTRFYDKSGALTSSATSVRYATQTVTPVYIWNNTYNGSPDVRALQVTWAGTYDSTVSPRVTEFIQSGRDYFNNAGAAPDYTPYPYPHPDRPDGAPAVTTLTINPAGTTMTVNLSQSCTTGAGGAGGMVVAANGGASTATYSSGSGTSAYVYGLSRTIQAGETVSLTYTQPGNGIETTAAQVDLASFDDQVVTNNSTSAPVAPSNLTATPAAEFRINLAWDDNSGGVATYSIERSLDGSTGWSVIASPVAGTEEYADQGLAAATTYYYRVRALSGGVYSTYTSTANATTPGSKPFAPSLRNPASLGGGL